MECMMATTPIMKAKVLSHLKLPYHNILEKNICADSFVMW
uniref:Uncharacterized protein n=1 Tax=Arundo donax TaxID=35708 RepID=A0A0A9G3Q2_ARUDO